MLALAVATAAAATASLTFGVAAPGLPARRSALAAAFHVSLTLVQAGFWWRFTGGRSVSWRCWLALALLAALVRAGLRVGTVLLDETDVLADVELPILVMHRPLQKIVFRLYFVGVGIIQVAVRARAPSARVPPEPNGAAPRLGFRSQCLLSCSPLFGTRPQVPLLFFLPYNVAYQQREANAADLVKAERDRQRLEAAVLARAAAPAPRLLPGLGGRPMVRTFSELELAGGVSHSTKAGQRMSWWSSLLASDRDASLTVQSGHGDATSPPLRAPSATVSTRIRDPTLRHALRIARAAEQVHVGAQLDRMEQTEPSPCDASEKRPDGSVTRTPRATSAEAAPPAVPARPPPTLAAAQAGRPLASGASQPGQTPGRAMDGIERSSATSHSERPQGADALSSRALVGGRGARGEQSPAAFPAPVWRAWACCGSVVPPSELELWYLVHPASPGWNPHADALPWRHVCCDPSGRLWCWRKSARRVAPSAELGGSQQPSSGRGASSQAGEGALLVLSAAKPDGSDREAPQDDDGIAATTTGQSVSGGVLTPARTPRRLLSRKQAVASTRVGAAARFRMARDACMCLSAPCSRAAKGDCCRRACTRRGAAWPPGFMTVVGTGIAILSTAVGNVPFETGSRLTLSVASFAIAVAFCAAVIFDSARREGSRRRLDGGSLLGALVILDTAMGGSGAALEIVTSLRSVGGLVFVGALWSYQIVASGVIWVWQLVAPAVMLHPDHRHSFLLVLELAMTMSTLMTLVLSQPLTRWEFWVSLLSRAGALVLLKTQAPDDLFAMLRGSRAQARYATAARGDSLGSRTLHSLAVEQLACGCVAAVICTEQLLWAVGWIDIPVLALSTAEPGKETDALWSALAALVAIGLIAVPLAETRVRQKMARSRLRAAIIATLAAVRLGQGSKAGTASVEPASVPPRAEAPLPQRFATQLSIGSSNAVEFAVVVVFAVLARVSGVYNVMSKHVTI